MTANMYRVGDYVYFETSSTSPYQIRRIEELNKTPSGNVEAKVMCFYRRRDLPPQLIQLADKHQCALDETNNGSPTPSESALSTDQLTPKQRHQMKHRELFLSRQVETLPATHIRGKCSVTLLNETEALCSYLNKDDMFFYCLVYDPTQKTLLADKGEIRVGSRYQCEIPPLLAETETAEAADTRQLSETETLVWTPMHQLNDRQIDQMLVVARSVGTFARALDCSSSVKQPSLHMSAAAASRDITLFHAMDTLHRHQYDLANALCSLVPSSGPVLCRDEMEEWSASEANLFEEALDKYGKDFNDIRNDFLSWKTLKNIIEYYYMWKTTDRYVQQKRVKAVEAESKLKQVYIPNYNKPNPVALNNTTTKGVLNGNSNGTSQQESNAAVSLSGKACESCNGTNSTQWYSWGPTHLQCRLCHQCWSYWKKYGGLKIATRFADGMDFETSGKKRSGSDVEDDNKYVVVGHRPHRCNIAGCGKEFKLKAHLGRHYATAHGLAVRSGSPRPVMKTRTAFYLLTTQLTKLSRRLCRHMMKPRHAARSPSFAINIQAVKQECATQMANKTQQELNLLKLYRKRNRGSVTAIASRLGRTGGPPTPQWLILTDKTLLPQPDVMAFPKPPKAPDGSLLYERVPNKPEAEKIPLNNLSSPTTLLRRSYDEMNGIDSSSINAPAAKRLAKEPLTLMTSSTTMTTTMPRHMVTGITSGIGGVGGVAGGLMGSSSGGGINISATPLILQQQATSNTTSTSTTDQQQYAHNLMTGAAPPTGHQHYAHHGAHQLPAQIIMGPMPRQVAQVNGKPKIAQMTRSGSGRKQFVNWMDAPDDLYFKATENIKKMRRQISSAELRRAARKPWRLLKPKMDENIMSVVVLD